ncbi:MAG: hypothetical protein ACLQAT_08765 [Candidatus Binataceae bacterium]
MFAWGARVDQAKLYPRVHKVARMLRYYHPMCLGTTGSLKGTTQPRHSLMVPYSQQLESAKWLASPEAWLLSESDSAVVRTQKRMLRSMP